MLDSITIQYIQEGLTEQDKSLLKKIIEHIKNNTKSSKSNYTSNEIISALDLDLTTSSVDALLDKAEFVKILNKKVNSNSGKVTYNFVKDKEFLSEVANIL